MSDGTRLIFDWPGRHNLQLVLPLTIALAIILHLGVFFVFSIVYPNKGGEGPDYASVYFPLPGSLDADRLKALLQIADPATFAPGWGQSADVSSASKYLPTYAAPDLKLEGLPPQNRTPQAYRAPLGAVEIPKLKIEVPESPSALGTRLVVSSTLAGREPAMPGDVRFVSSGRLPADSPRFLISVAPDGAVTNVFLQSSSGNTDLDGSAARQLARMSFRAADAGTIWGDVFFVWGNDVRGSAEE